MEIVPSKKPEHMAPPETEIVDPVIDPALPETIVPQGTDAHESAEGLEIAERLKTIGNTALRGAGEALSERGIVGRKLGRFILKRTGEGTTTSTEEAASVTTTPETETTSTPPAETPTRRSIVTSVLKESGKEKLENAGRNLKLAGRVAKTASKKTAVKSKELAKKGKEILDDKKREGGQKRLKSTADAQAKYMDKLEKKREKEEQKEKELDRRGVPSEALTLSKRRTSASKLVTLAREYDDSHVGVKSGVGRYIPIYKRLRGKPAPLVPAKDGKTIGALFPSHQIRRSHMSTLKALEATRSELYKQAPSINKLEAEVEELSARLDDITDPSERESVKRQIDQKRITIGSFDRAVIDLKEKLGKNTPEERLEEMSRNTMKPIKAKNYQQRAARVRIAARGQHPDFEASEAKARSEAAKLRNSVGWLKDQLGEADPELVESLLGDDTAIIIANDLRERLKKRLSMTKSEFNPPLTETQLTLVEKDVKRLLFSKFYANFDINKFDLEDPEKFNAFFSLVNMENVDFSEYHKKAEHAQRKREMETRVIESETRKRIEAEIRDAAFPKPTIEEEILEKLAEKEKRARIEAGIKDARELDPAHIRQQILDKMRQDQIDERKAQIRKEVREQMMDDGVIPDTRKKDES